MSLIAKLRALEAAGIAVVFATPSNEPAAPTDAPTETRADAIVRTDGVMTPAKAHRLRVLAASGGRVIAASGLVMELRADNDDAPGSPEEANVRIMLLDHKRSLKEIQSLSSKIELKRQLLPLYAPWVDGVLAADSGRQDDVLVTVMIWRIDVGDFLEALPLVDYVLRHKLDMPAHIDRSPATFVTEEISEAALKAYDLGVDQGAAFPAGALGALEDLVELEDMPDEVRAKLQKAIGRAILAGGDADDARARQEETLKRYLKAMTLNPKAGVKKDIAALQKQLNKEETPALSAAAAVGAALHNALAATAKTNTPPSDQAG